MLGFAFEHNATQIARGLALASTLSEFGTLVFCLFVAGPAVGGLDAETAQALARQFTRILRWSLAGAVFGGLTLLPLQTAEMTGEATLSAIIAAAPFVLAETTFGHALALRILLLVVAVYVAASLQSRRRTALATLCAGAAVALQARMGHAAAAEDVSVSIGETLHVLAAGAWIGALLPLRQAIIALPGPSAERAARRFSALGGACVLILVATAVAQSGALIGDFGGWFGTPYGWMALAKIGLFAALLGFAALNSILLTPRLLGRSGLALALAKRAIALSIALETAVGLAAIFTASGLAVLEPGAHVQPVWPFAHRPDFESWFADAFVRREVLRAAALLGAALAAAACLFWRRARVIALGLACAAFLFLPQPNLKLLVAEAYPTSFYRSPTGFSVASIASGGEIVTQNCSAECFRGEDDPSDLTPYGIWRRRDGDFFWWLTAVFDRIGHSPFPRGFIGWLSEDDRWRLIDYFRARVAGSAVKRRGVWPYPAPAPDMELKCGLRRTRLSALRGRVLRLVAIDGRFDGTPTGPEDALTIVLIRGGGVAPASFCRSADKDAWSAYALISGLSEEELAGVEILIDANGWLRNRRIGRSLAAGGSSDALRAEIRAIADHPIGADARAGHLH